VAVPDALIRAYLYMDAEGLYTSQASAARSVLEIGEARADENGRFELLVPSSLN
jgi:hypothetical protein